MKEVCGRGTPAEAAAAAAAAAAEAERWSQKAWEWGGIEMIEVTPLISLFSTRTEIVFQRLSKRGYIP